VGESKRGKGVVFMKKTEKRVSIWKPLALSICLLLTAQHKAYAYGEEEDETIPADILVPTLLVVGGILLLVGFIATTEETNKEKAVKQDRINTATAEQQAAEKQRICIRARDDERELQSLCDLRKDNDTCEKYISARRRADEMCR
jgi:hypothetical protein